jgi:hypothetical protein
MAEVTTAGERMQRFFPKSAAAVSAVAPHLDERLRMR